MEENKSSDSNNVPSVLIVDDNLTNMNLLMDFLINYGFKTYIAEDGESALRRLEFIKPDIILLDVLMPGIDGFETCKFIKEKENLKDIPIIFMTALSDLIDKVKGFKLGAVDYITKPFQYEELLARINTHLTIKNQKEELFSLNKKLIDINKKLSEINATKDRFFSIISHDLRGIFSPLITSSDVLVKIVKVTNNDKIIQFSKNIQKSVRNAYNLLENLLEWSRIQRQGIKYNPRKIDIYEVCKKNVELLNSSATQKGISLSSKVSNNSFIFADMYMIDTIIRNLISNAIKFTDKDGKIIIGSKLLDKQYEISILDTGVGIDQENVKKLFRIDEKYKTKGTNGEIGTGLGLILCKELIEKNKGSIWVESELDHGSVFFFNVPCFIE